MTTHNQELLSTLVAEQNELEEVVHYLTHLLKGTYVFENNTFALQEWVTLFIDNPIGKQIAKKLVWEADHQVRFMIGDHAYVDQRNAAIDIQHFQAIAVALSPPFTKRGINSLARDVSSTSHAVL